MTPYECQKYGIQALHALGARQTELNMLSPLSAATLKRYCGAPPRGLELRPPRLRRLTDKEQHVLTWFWVESVVAFRPQALPRDQRRFLDLFCPVCVDRAGDAPGETERRADAGGEVDRNLRMITADPLVEAVTEGLLYCVAGTGPNCVSGPARLAALCAYLKIRPWAAYEWIRDEVAPQRWWIRPCLGECGTRFASSGRDVRLCPACAALAARESDVPAEHFARRLNGAGR